jgi:hypothetical protein
MGTISENFEKKSFSLSVTDSFTSTIDAMLASSAKASKFRSEVLAEYIAPEENYEVFL